MQANVELLELCNQIESGEFDISMATEEMLDDTWIALSFVKNDGLSLRHFSQNVRGRAYVVNEALKNNHHAIAYATPEFKSSVICCIMAYQAVKTPYFDHGHSFFGHLSPIVLNNLEFLSHLKPAEVAYIFLNHMDDHLKLALSNRTAGSKELLHEAVRALLEDQRAVV